MAYLAEEMAIRLIDLYRNDKDKKKGIYRLSKESFKTIAGKASLRDAYLRDVDANLREDGFMIMDMREEHNQIAIISMAAVMKHFQEIQDELVDENACPADDEDEW